MFLLEFFGLFLFLEGGARGWFGEWREFFAKMKKDSDYEPKDVDLKAMRNRIVEILSEKY